MGMSGARDEPWFSALYADHHAHIVKYALRRLGDPDASTDLAQEVFVVAWRRRDEVPEHGLPWLYGVARRLLANHWRARRRAPVFVPLEPDQRPGETGRPGRDRLHDVRVAVASLSEADQEILRLIGWEELSLVDAATVLGCRTATATVRLHRARKRLLQALRTHAPEGILL
jgi:RNA polymerase sigma factor (sigma-70 family)